MFSSSGDKLLNKCAAGIYEKCHSFKTNYLKIQKLPKRSEFFKLL